MSHDHCHAHASASAGKIWVALGLTLALCVGEAVFGIAANVLSLISDAGHNLGDVLALGLSGYAAWIGAKPANARYTYGYHRAAILAPLFNAATLAITAFVIAGAALIRLYAPQPVAAGPMIWIAAAALVINGATALWLAGDIRHSLNDRSVFVHLVGDTLSSMAVIAGGVLIHYTGWSIVDPIVSLAIAAYILYSAVGILRPTIGILMENAPPGLDIVAIAHSIRGIEPVQSVHHLHVWSIRDGMTALSCHVTLPETCSLRDCSATVTAINERLHDEFGIHHATIQTELDGRCVAIHDDMLCDSGG